MNRQKIIFYSPTDIILKKMIEARYIQTDTDIDIKYQRNILARAVSYCSYLLIYCFCFCMLTYFNTRGLFGQIQIEAKKRLWFHLMLILFITTYLWKLW